MTIQEMHYDFKLGINKVDTQKSRNVVPAQIDFLLNKATMDVILELYYPGKGLHGFDQIHSISMELGSLHRGFETEPPLPVTLISSDYGNIYQVNFSDASQPVLFVTNLLPKITKGECGSRLVGSTKILESQITQVMSQSHYRPSYKWRMVPVTYREEVDAATGVSIPVSASLFTGGDFMVEEVRLSYLRRPRTLFIGGYDSLDNGYSSTDSPVSSDLPITIHNRIVLTAVKNYFRQAQDTQNYQMASQELLMIERQKT